MSNEYANIGMLSTPYTGKKGQGDYGPVQFQYYNPSNSTSISPLEATYSNSRFVPDTDTVCFTTGRREYACRGWHPYLYSGLEIKSTNNSSSFQEVYKSSS